MTGHIPEDQYEEAIDGHGGEDFESADNIIYR